MFTWNGHCALIGMYVPKLRSELTAQMGAASMGKISVIGLDLAKNVLHVHGVDERGEVVARKILKC